MVSESFISVFSDESSQHYLERFWPRPLERGITLWCLCLFVCFNGETILTKRHLGCRAGLDIRLVIILAFSVGRTKTHTHIITILTQFRMSGSWLQCVDFISISHVSSLGSWLARPPGRGSKMSQNYILLNATLQSQPPQNNNTNITTLNQKITKSS